MDRTDGNWEGLEIGELIVELWQQFRSQKSLTWDIRRKCVRKMCGGKRRHVTLWIRKTEREKVIQMYKLGA